MTSPMTPSSPMRREARFTRATKSEWFRSTSGVSRAARAGGEASCRARHAIIPHLHPLNVGKYCSLWAGVGEIELKVARAKVDRSTVGWRPDSAWRRFENSGVPLALKWTLAISLMICVGMGGLGAFLIDQQKASYQEQISALGHTIANQLAHAASEPLMADDHFTLQLLVKQQADLPLILAMRIEDASGRVVAAIGDEWGDDRMSAERFRAPIRYQDVNAGVAEVLLDRAPLDQSLHTLLLALVTITLLFILITVLLAFPLARRFARPFIS